ncbi:MAG: trypsin-like peptidase domain-containing protein [Candidatus Rokubacteria bacterium]|nr:trypsin-like peptidase domain-containing protein [Candidatus Rokubacteria bacterium]
MRRCLRLLAVSCLAAGCASTAGVSERGEVIRRILPSTVQLRAEREGGGRRAASGVVLASDSKSGRSWIVTTRHFLDPPRPQEIYVSMPRRKGRVKAVVSAVSSEIDLAVIEVEGVELPPVRFKEVVQLGDEVWVVAFPWGRRLTLASGVVSQIASQEGEVAVEGMARMVDASVSYGASGGGVFDAVSGALVGIVEGYRTARVAVPEAPDRVLQVPVPGETTVISSGLIFRFLLASGLEFLIPK